MNDLISPISGEWDEEIIKHNFCPIDAYAILVIPLALDRDDFVAWHKSKTGVFFSMISVFWQMES